MAPTTTGVRLTPLATLIDKALRNRTFRPEIGLGTYLAIGRTPGPDWMTFDQLADTLGEIGSWPMNRVSLLNWARDVFEIPDTRLVDGRKMPREATADQLNAYLSGLNPDIIDVEAVREQALFAAADRDETTRADALAKIEAAQAGFNSGE
jgi:hypothetical protein